MATGAQVWSQTAASNATADSNVNWAEGQAPSSVNDSARAVMASFAKWRDDNSGSLVTSGTSLAYTLVTNQIEGSLTSGYTVAMQFHVTNGAAATLAVDGLAATPLQVYPGQNALGGEWTTGSWGTFTYSTTGTGQWVCKSPPGFPVLSNTLSAAVVLTTSFQVGPTVSQSTNPGTWFVTGGVTLLRSGGTDQILVAKLWDGTGNTTIASGATDIVTAGSYDRITLSGIITNPAGNIHIAARKTAGATASMASTLVENTGLSNITAIRIA